MGLLKEKGFTGKIKLNHLIHFLSGTEGTSKEVLRNAIVRHHQSGVKFGSATNDLALTTQTINKGIQRAETNIRKGIIKPEDIQKLKNNNVYVRHQGKLYGSGSKTAIGQFKQIESSVAKALESGKTFAGTDFSTKQLTKYLTQLCPKKASGGRIGLQGGGSTACGKDRLKRIMNGSKATKPEIGIIKKIMGGTGKFLKSIVNPLEWIRLRNLIGPEAMLFFGGIEAAVISYDHLEKGTPWKEAAAGNWATGWAMEKTLEEYQIENMKNLTPGAKKWATGIKLIGEYDRLNKELEGMKLGIMDPDPATTKELYYKRKEIEKKEKEFVKHMIDNKMSMKSLEQTSGGALEFQAAVTERDATELAKDIPEEGREPWYPGKWHDFWITGRRKEKDRYVSTGEGPRGMGKKVGSRGEIIKKGIFTGWPELEPKITHVDQYNLPPSIIGKKDFFANVPYYQGIPGQLPMGPISGRPTAPVKDYTPRTYQSIKESKRPSQLETLEQKKERFRRMILEPGMLGTQDKFAGGGMVGIRKPNAIAPTGGPMHQGLRSLYINDKDY